MAGINRRQVGVSLSLCFVSDIDWLLAPAISHASLAVAVLRHHKLLIVVRSGRLLAVLRAREEVLQIRCIVCLILLLVVRVVYVEVQVHVHIDWVKVVTVTIAVTDRIPDAGHLLIYVLLSVIPEPPLRLVQLLLIDNLLNICGSSIVADSVRLVSLITSVLNSSWKSCCRLLLRVLLAEAGGRRRSIFQRHRVLVFAIGNADPTLEKLRLVARCVRYLLSLALFD